MIGAWASGAAVLVLATSGQPAPDTAEAQIAGSLDTLHAAATQVDATTYLGRLDPEVVWIGNDVAERWTYPEFEAFVSPYFERGEGWTYSARERRVWLAPDPCECLAWVDEVLDSRTYGTAVSNLIMRRADNGDWRIWRNALTYPIPNDLAREMTGEIKAWEEANPQPPRLPELLTVETLPINDLLDALHQAAHVVPREHGPLPRAVAGVVREHDGEHGHDLVADPLQREHRRRVADVAVGDCGLDRKDSHNDNVAPKF